MDSFKIYLPSNASVDYFPNNTASKYQTHLTDPIQLEGNWEAGLESIFYSSKIGDEEETATFTIRAIFPMREYLYELYPLTYLVNQKVIPFKWISSPHTPSDYTGNTLRYTVESLVKLLNSTNSSILYNRNAKVFTFRKDGEHIVFKGETNGIVIVLKHKIARALGFGWKHVFCGNAPIRGLHKKVMHKVWHMEDFNVWAVDTNVLKRVARIVIKNPGFSSPKSRAIFKQKWLDMVEKTYKVRATFSKSGKLIVKNFTDQILRFSKDFSEAFSMAEVIIGNLEEWATSAFDTNNSFVDGFWYMDIFSQELEFNLKNRYLEFDHVFKPRHFFDVQNIIMMMNEALPKQIEKDLGPIYHNSTNHKYKFSLEKNHVKMELNKWIEVLFSKNLAFLLGFDNTHYDGGTHVSKRLPATLEQREQHLFILSDVIQSTSYGNMKVDILQEFVHEGDTNKKQLIEKRFHPITYNPVKSSYIENIAVTIANELLLPVFINDSKTVVIIHFRKRN